MIQATACLQSALLLSTAFFLIFTASSGLDTLMTSVIPGKCDDCLEGEPNGICQEGNVCHDKVAISCDRVCEAPFQECTSSLGTTILGLAYLTFMLSAIAGPFVTKQFGEQRSMVGSSLAMLYGVVNLIVALNPTKTQLHWFVMIPASIITGFSSSVIWISQASYLTHLSVTYASLQGLPTTSSALGLFTGLFFVGYNMSQISGNLVSSIVLGSLAWSTATLFIIYIVFALSGTFLLSLLPTTSQLALEEDVPTEKTLLIDSVAPSTWISLWNMAQDPRMVLLAPTMIFHGLQQGFVTGEFTSHVIRKSLGSASIGYVMEVYGLVNVASAYVFGKLADRLGPSVGQFLGFVLAFTAYAVCYWANLSTCGDQWTLVLCTAILLSLVDTATTTLVNVILGREFVSDTIDAFSLFRVYHAGAASFSFLVFGYLSFQDRLVVLMTVVCLATVSFTLFCIRHRHETTIS
ncbi:unnamed protein product [Aphanomyces euteiches]|uniref:Major facilitator superfamily (MFS) profile domain-containing protein n=1 Tax=Aphanomyces euteiches TaxID=100861 RepID=A0A6G0WJX8_9STRA|nr:hypothetical protein Ae201684_014354 [Aphanomyces euteiches]KAH9141464.1 hypothetical protein AeRB84_014355 [Aphanomyces euteiches]